MRIRGSDALGEYVLHSRNLENRSNRAPCDHAGARAGGAQEHSARAKRPFDLVGNGGSRQGNLEQVLLRLLSTLADRFGNLIGLAQARTHIPALVANHHQGRKREPPAALDDLGDAVDEDNAVNQFANFFVVNRHSCS